MPKAICKELFREEKMIGSAGQVEPVVDVDEEGEVKVTMPPSVGVLAEVWCAKDDDYFLSHYLISTVTFDSQGNRTQQYKVIQWGSSTDADVIRQAIAMLDEAVANHPDAKKSEQAAREEEIPY